MRCRQTNLRSMSGQSKIPRLNWAITTACNNPVSFCIIGHWKNLSFLAPLVASFNQKLMSEVLIHAHWFWIEVPLAQSAVLTARHKQTLRFGVPLSIVDCCNVSFCIVHIMKIHVASYCCLLFCPIRLKNLCLVTLNATKKEIWRWGPWKWIDWVAIERFKIFKRS